MVPTPAGTAIAIVALPPASLRALAVFNLPPDETRTVTGVPVGMLVSGERES